MKIRTGMWILVVGAVVAALLKWVLPLPCNIDLPLLIYLWYHLFFPIGLSVIHIALCICIWRDAGRRDSLLLGIPAWVWGLIGLTLGILGLAAHWLANCSRFVRDQTIPIKAEKG